jgi:hypothetical protein
LVTFAPGLKESWMINMTAVTIIIGIIIIIGGPPG